MARKHSARGGVKKGLFAPYKQKSEWDSTIPCIECKQAGRSYSLDCWKCRLYNCLSAQTIAHIHAGLTRNRKPQWMEEDSDI